MNTTKNMFDRMTPAQQARLGGLMMRDLLTPCYDNHQTVELERKLAQLKASPSQSVRKPSTIDELLDGIEHLQDTINAKRESDKMRMVEQMFDREELFRFAYVPFVIAELVWDYADTVIIMARHVGDQSTKRLSRAIRNARSEYDHLRRRHIDESNRERELENGYVFEDGVKDITNQLLLNISLDINSEYPQLNEDGRNLLLAVYQCHILSRALLQYIEKQRQRASQRIGSEVGNLLPQSYFVMDKLIPKFIGDKPASSRFKKLMSQYIDTLATQIALVGLNDTTDNQEEQ